MTVGFPSTVEQKSQMVGLYLEGSTAKEAADAVGLTEVACYNALRRAGIARRKRTSRARKKFTAAEEQLICREYEAGESSGKLAENFKCTVQTVLAVVRRQGGIARAMGPLPTYPEEVRRAAVETYLSGKTLEESAALFNIQGGGGVVRTFLEERGIPRRPMTETHRTYTLNQEFFAAIDSEEKAYWLGFLTADGCVYFSRNSYYVSLGLKATDADHVKRFGAALGSNAPVRFTSCMSNGVLKETASLGLCSARLAADLIRLGVHERKSLVVRPWQGDAGLMRHYWRGVVDGDGHLRCTLKRSGAQKGTHKGTKKWIVGLCGSFWVVSGFAAWVKREAGYAAVVYPHRSIFRTTVTSLEGSQAVASLLYKDAAVSLNRKMGLAEKMMAGDLQHGNSGRRKAFPTEGELQALYARFGEWVGVARHLGVHPDAVRYMRKVAAGLV